MIRVIIESPFRGDRTRNVEYAQECMRDSISRGEAPFASHLLYPQVLNDDIEQERKLGIDMNLEWIGLCDRLIVYADFGITEGMQKAVQVARAYQKPISIRRIKS